MSLFPRNKCIARVGNLGIKRAPETTVRNVKRHQQRLLGMESKKKKAPETTVMNGKSKILEF